MDQFSWALEQFTSCTEKEEQKKKKRLSKEEKTGARHRRTVHDIQLTGSVSVVSFLWRRVGLRLCVWEHAILNVALKNSHQAAPCWPWAESEQTLQAGNQDFNRAALSSDPESLGQMQDVTTTPHPLLLFSPLPPAPSHYPHLSILLDLLPSTPLPPPPLCKLLFYWMAAHSVANQEHSSPMRWHERPTLRSSFTILRTASSRPRPRWSNRQSCCSGRRWSMQKT